MDGPGHRCGASDELATGVGGNEWGFLRFMVAGATMCEAETAENYKYIKKVGEVHFVEKQEFRYLENPWTLKICYLICTDFP